MFRGLLVPPEESPTSWISFWGFWGCTGLNFPLRATEGHFHCRNNPYRNASHASQSLNSNNAKHTVHSLFLFLLHIYFTIPWFCGRGARFTLNSYFASMIHKPYYFPVWINNSSCCSITWITSPFPLLDLLSRTNISTVRCSYSCFKNIEDYNNRCQQVNKFYFLFTKTA